MALQHHEFELRLRDIERLPLYVQSGMAERETQSASLKEDELTCHRLELEAKESTERLPGQRLRGMRRVMRRRWPSCISKGPLIPEHRWSLSLLGFNVP